MSQFALSGGKPFTQHALSVSAERQGSSTPTVLALETLEHGAYYGGELGVTPTIARWHAKKRRFVFGEFALGRQHVRSATHVADNGTEERFSPLIKIEPKGASRVSDYAFETAG